ncbi:energy transducer TonB [uncultured Polaribacter sp.]|uniref:energy transducer TonB n=1 Tax=uncultured Polaribacter sp. TaxID=174711 RepID=UPI00260392C4|nr:energy transducer TonB [uncultured Polaribacter sp.]
MKNRKKQPNKQLEKFSNIFTQLGLVLILFIVYITLEHQTEQKKVIFSNESTKDNMVYVEPNTEILFTKEAKPKPKPTPQKTVFVVDEPIKKGDDKVIETIIDVSEKTPDLIDIDKVNIVEGLDDEPIVEDVDFVNVQFAPIFKGCENLSKKENKICFDRKMKQFVQRNFDIELANEIGLRSGKHKIRTQFIIDDKGEIIDIKIATKHKTLKKEAKRIIKKLPKFKPGQQNNRAVKVKYYMPISFSIE